MYYFPKIEIASKYNICRTDSRLLCSLLKENNDNSTTLRLYVIINSKSYLTQKVSLVSI